MNSLDFRDQLVWAIKRLSKAQSSKLDGLRLEAAVRALSPGLEPQQALGVIAARMGFVPARWLVQPDDAHLPALGFTAKMGWIVILSMAPGGGCRVVSAGGNHVIQSGELENRSAVLSTRGTHLPIGATALLGLGGGPVGFLGHAIAGLRLYRRDLFDASLATLFIGILALITSLFSMQVYDRVIPTRNEYTLLVLTSGVALTIGFELVLKFVRSRVMDYVVVGLDNRLSREVFSRLLSLRVDQIPQSVGSLASQVRGYEQIRAFFTSTTLFALVDFPLAIFFVVVIFMLGHVWVAVVPLLFGIVSLAFGLSIRRRVMLAAQEGAQYSNLKTGLLVETVEGIETIKTGMGGWKFQSRWVDLNHNAIHTDLKMRHVTDSVGYYSAALQQLSYITLIAVGATVVMQGSMTTGALIACSILGGRVLTPVMALPGLLVQHAQAKAALEGIEKLYQLKTDNHGIDQPLVPDSIRGEYLLKEASLVYADSPPSLKVGHLHIQAGECVLVLGPIGAGKSSLLRLLSGLYPSSTGQVLLDGLDLLQIHRQTRGECVGYLQQDHRLFNGTLRENLLIGYPDPGDEDLLAVMRSTGFDQVVASHPRGLERMIVEGGRGLSVGQKQLLAFTRIAVTNPSVWLLDEPTASMDDEQEKRCLSVLNQQVALGKTLVIVTHKMAMLPLATRIVVIVGQSIVLDGPRDVVLQQLQQNQKAQTEPQQASS